MYVTVLDSCVGCGACAIINPEVFEMNGNKVNVISERVDDTEDLCIDAAITSLVNAIEIEDC